MTRRLFELALETKWAMRPETIHAMLGVLHRHDLGEKLEAAEIARVRSIKNDYPGGWMARAMAGSVAAVQVNGAEPDITLTQVGSVAVIGVGGVIAKYASSVNQASSPNGTSVEAIRTVLASTLADPQIGSVLLLIDSPGGSVSGLATLAAEIRDASKPVWAFIDDLGASAAYWIASQADMVYQSPGAVVGSIGVYAPVADTSAAHAQRGIKVHLVKAGDAKGIGTPGVAITQPQLDLLQAEVDKFYGQFVGDVAAGRPRLAGDKLAQVADGRVWIGQEAVDVGLTDGVAMLGDVIARMNAEFAPAARGAVPGVRRYARGGVVPAADRDAVAVLVGERGEALVPASAVTRTELNAGPSLKVGLPQSGVTPGMQAGTGAQAGPSLTVGLLSGGLLPSGLPQDGLSNETKEPAVHGTAIDTPAKAGDLPRVAAGAGGISGGAGEGLQMSVEVVTGAAQAQGTTGTPVDVKAIEDAVLTRERTRQAEIRQAGLPFMHIAAVAALVATATAGAMTVDDFNRQAMKLVAENTAPAPSVDVSVGGSGADRQRLAYSLVLADRASGGNVRAALQGANAGKMERVMRAVGVSPTGTRNRVAMALHEMEEAEASGMRGATMMDIARESLRGSAKVGRHDIDGLWKASASHTTSDFPIITKNTAYLVQQAAFVETPTTWQLWAKRGSSNDYKDTTIAAASELGNLKLVPEGKDAVETTMNERAEVIRVNMYAEIFKLTYQAFRNDSLGFFTELPAKMGQAAARLPEDLLYTALEANAAMSDSVTYFNATHKNLSGTNDAISYAAIKAAYTAMAKQTGFGPDKAKIDVNPRFLIVPTALELTAGEILNSEYAPSTGSTPINTRNQLTGKLAIVGSNRLTSDTAYYLAADPRLVPAFQINFLDGQEAPEIDQLEGDNPYVLKWQATVKGVGVSAINYEAMYKNAGA